ncbi:MAG: DNA polymerase IV [Acidimicrobiales bacterium]|nr:DNA polymerase IV [Acidimicrobiales bacterium]
MAGPGAHRTILHVDMDAFFVAVERIRDPSLVGKAVVVGGDGERGVVAAASYEARRYGVHSAMPSTRARRLCPHAVFVQGDHRAYSEVSARVMELFRSYTPLVEPLSLDEAFLDLSGALRRWGSGEAVGHDIRRRVQEEEHLTCCVGVAPNKFLAKLASQEAKPRASMQGIEPGEGVTVVAPGAELAFLHPLPVGRLWGVGPVTRERLERLGVTTVADLAALPLDVVVGALGKASGAHLHALAHALDDRAVVPDQAPKSISHEETYPHDHHRRGPLEQEVVRMADAVATRLRANDMAARTVVLKVRFGDFRTITRSVTLTEAVDTGPALARAAKALLDDVDPSPGVRLLGVGAANLTAATAQQLALFDEPSGEGQGADLAEWSDASRAVDEIRERFGAAAIGPARLAGPGGLRVKRRGDQQWGPGADEASID